MTAQKNEDMMKPSRLLAVAALMLPVLLGACAMTPPADVRQPMTARPAPLPRVTQADGAIYQAKLTRRTGYSYRPLFEDRRARAVGDVLTININETTAASKTADTTAARTNSNTMGVTGLSGLPGKSLLGSNLAASSDNSFEGKGASTTNNTFTGIITVTVTDVLANGNLVVSGEKQIGINQGSEYVRFSGVVNPAWISPANDISSTKVADARLEYRGNGYIDEAQTMPWLARFFLSVLPF